ncbi:MAG TPA: sugar transferase [Gemmatimonadaceae bacterium]|jgi:lipopolysaccharide/colanic/teichoic acid biosynthesis glycosyltransferase
MRIIPIILDSRPGYLGNRSSDSTLLQLPVGDRTLAAEIVESIAQVTAHAPSVLPTMDVDANYMRRITASCPEITQMVDAERYRDPLAYHDAADTLLVVSPACYPADGLDLESLVSSRLNDARMARHLLAFEASSLRTKELVHSGADGKVRRIQRYFEPVTWPFPAGMVASLVPIACLLTHNGLPIASLDDLRKLLSGRGVPSQDVPFQGEFFDINDESAALALIERRLLSTISRRASARPGLEGSNPLRAESAVVHPTARVVGPVIIADGVVIEENAVIVGPAVIGPNARIGRNSTVAQCFVTEEAYVSPELTVRQRVVANHDRSNDDGLYRRHTPNASSPAINNQSQRVGGAYEKIKPIGEGFVAFVLLVLLSPLMLFLAAAVKFTSEGPIFYGDRREGKGGKPFKCWKFRSMLTNADAMQRALAAQQQMDGPQFKMDRDPRVTAVGRWLRRLNVDELPQLFNVLRGQMSFVGPRPSPFRENQICIPWRNGRLSVRPGITGLWQVCRHDRANGDFHQWIQYDLLYVRHMSFTLDLKIFAATIVTAGGKWAVPLEKVIRNVETPRVAEAPADVQMKPRVSAATRKRRSMEIALN